MKLKHKGHKPAQVKREERDSRISVVRGKRVHAERKAMRAALHTGNIDYCGIFG